jgi:hypothetical protein
VEATRSDEQSFGAVEEAMLEICLRAASDAPAPAPPDERKARPPGDAVGAEVPDVHRLRAMVRRQVASIRTLRNANDRCPDVCPPPTPWQPPVDACRER